MYIITLISLCVLVVADDKLILSQIVFRHGSRAPISNATSEEGSSHFFRGPGALTDEGFQDGYNLGKDLRLRTNDLIDSRMIPSELEFESSPSSRCIQTAQAVAIGLFEKTNGRVAILPPINAPPAKENWRLYPNKCYKLTQHMAFLMNMENKNYEISEILQGKMKNLCEESKYWNDMSKCRKLEAYLLESRSNLAVPDWLTVEAEEEAEIIYSKTLQFATGSGRFRNETMLRIRGGLLIDTILKRIEEAVTSQENRTGYKKLFAYATHDILLLPLFDILGLKNFYEKNPPFAAALLIELWKSDNDYYVKFFYRKPQSSFIPLTRYVEFCGGKESCDYESVANSCKQFRTSEPWIECDNTQNSSGAPFPEKLLVFFTLFYFSKVLGNNSLFGA